MLETPPPMLLAYVSYGGSEDAMMASGVPYYLRRGFEQAAGVVVRDVSARPSTLGRLVMKGLSFRFGRSQWERNYLHGRILPWARSALRTRGIAKSAPDADAVLHVRTWYSPIDRPYASFIDATVTMVRGYDDTWALSDRQFEAEVAVEGAFYRQAMVVYTASRAATQSLIDDYGVDPDRIVQVGAGVTLTGLAEIEPTRLAERHASPNILFVGKDPMRKGLIELIDAFSLVREERPEATLTIVGPEADRDEFHGPGIRWHGLVEDKARMRELYEAATLFALPAHRESYGLVIPEAMSFGLPCVVSQTGELPFLVSDGEHGVVLDEIAPASIAAAIGSVLADLAHYANLSRAAHARARDFSWDHIAQTMTDDMSARLGRQGRPIPK